MTKTPYDIIQTLMLTEKSAILKERNQYAFKVGKKFSKLEIAGAVEKLYEVKVSSVNVINYKGKRKRAGRSPMMGRRPDWKKAVVTLAEGSIELA